MYLLSGCCIGTYFVGQISGTVHKPVGVVCQVKPVLAVDAELLVGACTGKQKQHHQHKRRDGDPV